MDFDIIILGGGAAGLSAAVYATRAGKKVLVIDEETSGGQVAATPLIENYPGFESISGFELFDKFYAHAKSSGAEFLYGKVESVDILGEEKNVYVGGKKYSAYGLIIATGISHKKLNLANERELLGRGISYCATCDGNFFRKKTVAVAGGISGVASAKYLAGVCEKVYLISETSLDGKKLYLPDNVEVIENASVKELVGTPLNSIVLSNSNSLSVSGLFVALGTVPQTDMFVNLIDMDEKGFIITDAGQCTSVDGVCAAGDVVKKTLRQIVTAVSDGAIAATSLVRYIGRKKNNKKI